MNSVALFHRCDSNSVIVRNRPTPTSEIYCVEIIQQMSFIECVHLKKRERLVETIN